MQEMIRMKAKELLSSGKANRVFGWTEGEFFYDLTPRVFTSEEEIDSSFVYSVFCGQNFSKALVGEAKKDGVIAVFFKPCDAYSFQQLLNEHRVAREKVYAVGIPCSGMADIDKIRSLGAKAPLSAKEEGDSLLIETLYGEKKMKKEEVLAERCLVCKSKKHPVFDELLGEEGEEIPSERFREVEKLEKMTSEERYAFWQNELSRCIRCNACRNACPACTCEKCVFDNPQSGVEQKAAATSFEEQLFHIIRAFHVAGRCTDCGECSRVCPQKIPLHLLNRKFIKDINTLYGPYQAGAEAGSTPPLTAFTYADAEPSVVREKGEEK